MKPVYRVLAELVRDENGGEVIEYSIVCGLIVLGAISVIGKIGTKVLAKWNSINSSM